MLRKLKLSKEMLVEKTKDYPFYQFLWKLFKKCSSRTGQFIKFVLLFIIVDVQGHVVNASFSYRSSALGNLHDGF